MATEPNILHYRFFDTFLKLNLSKRNFYWAIYNCKVKLKKCFKRFFSNRGIFLRLSSDYLLLSQERIFKEQELSTNCLLVCRTAYQQEQLGNLDLESVCKMSENR